MKKLYLKPVARFRMLPETDAILASGLDTPGILDTPEYEPDIFGGEL